MNEHTRARTLHESLDSRLESAQDCVPTQLRFEELLSEAAWIRLRRVAARTEYRYKGADPRSKDVLASDLLRKFHRVHSYLTGNMEGINEKDLRDDFLDLANFAIMGVQLGEIEGWLNADRHTGQATNVEGTTL